MKKNRYPLRDYLENHRKTKLLGLPELVDLIGPTQMAADIGSSRSSIYVWKQDGLPDKRTALALVAAYPNLTSIELLWPTEKTPVQDQESPGQGDSSPNGADE